MKGRATILDEIVQQKRVEIALQKQKTPVYELMAAEGFKRKCFSAKESISRDGASGIIAEFKRKSPSKGIINDQVEPQDVVKAYEKADVSMVSVLTDEQFFGANPGDFAAARKVLNIPLLRKEFIVDPYQIYESKAMGADVILLIAAILTPQRCKDLAFIAKDLGMEVLLELHDESEFEHVNHFVDLVGINNRNLKDFSVDTERSIRLAKRLPEQMIRVAESGLHSPEKVKEMREKGFQAFLMGEYFMKDEFPGEKCKELIESITN